MDLQPCNYLPCISSGESSQGIIGSAFTAAHSVQASLPRIHSRAFHPRISSVHSLPRIPSTHLILAFTSSHSIHAIPPWQNYLGKSLWKLPLHFSREYIRAYQPCIDAAHCGRASHVRKASWQFYCTSHRGNSTMAHYLGKRLWNTAFHFIREYIRAYQPCIDAAHCRRAFYRHFASTLLCVPFHLFISS